MFSISDFFRFEPFCEGAWRGVYRFSLASLASGVWPIRSQGLRHPSPFFSLKNTVSSKLEPSSECLRSGLNRRPLLGIALVTAHVGYVGGS